MASLATLRVEQSEAMRGNPTVLKALSGFFITLPEQERARGARNSVPVVKRTDETGFERREAANAFIYSSLMLSPSIVRQMLQYLTITQLRMLVAQLVGGDAKERREARRRLGLDAGPAMNKHKKTEEEEKNAALIFSPVAAAPAAILVMAPLALAAQTGWRGLAQVPSLVASGLRAVGRVGLSSLRKINAIVGPGLEMTASALHHPHPHFHASLPAETI
jgi:hypothetical protein